MLRNRCSLCHAGKVRRRVLGDDALPGLSVVPEPVSHWESQTQRRHRRHKPAADTSSTEAVAAMFWPFVRSRRKDERGQTAPYVCLGQANYVRHEFRMSDQGHVGTRTTDAARALPVVEGRGRLAGPTKPDPITSPTHGQTGGSSWASVWASANRSPTSATRSTIVRIVQRSGRSVGVVELVPGDRRGHRRAGARAGPRTARRAS